MGHATHVPPSTAGQNAALPRGPDHIYGPALAKLRDAVTR
jgi:hypothetical protein